MDQTLSSDDIVALTRRVAALYVEEAPYQTLGEWVLGRFYADIDRYALPNLCDFVGAVRTFDARMYLSGLLRRGCLCATPLVNAVAHREFDPAQLRMIGI